MKDIRKSFNMFIAFMRSCNEGKPTLMHALNWVAMDRPQFEALKKAAEQNGIKMYFDKAAHWDYDTDEEARKLLKNDTK